MERSYFAVVKEAFAADLDVSLNALGVDQFKGGNPGWKAICCPICSDSNGSASVNRENGFLNCKQCSRKLDLFEWWRELHRCKDDWEACHQVGEKLGCKYAQPTGKKRKTAGRMNEKLLDQCIHDLIESPEAEWARDFLKKRKLWNIQILARCGVGFFMGSIVFAQFNIDGSIRERYRMYTPNQKVKWHWSKLGSGAPTGLWPAYNDFPAKGKPLLCEGEFDVLAALIIGEVHLREEPLVPYCSTGGGGSALSSSLMPLQWPQNTVYVCYDNDIFQGPDTSTYRAPDDKKMRDMLRRRETFLTGVVGKLVANKCEVILCHVNIDPVDHFGADLRDWLTSGKTFDDLDQYGYRELVERTMEAREMTHEEVYRSAGDLVKFQGSVTEIVKHGMAVPIVSRIDCPKDTKNCCRDCPVPRKFPDQEIIWADNKKHLLNALMSTNPEQYIIRKVIGKPAACNECNIEHEEATVGSHWRAGSDHAVGDEGMKMIDIISTEEPSLSGSIGITGHAYFTTDSVGVYAVKLDQMDKPEVNLDDYHQDLLMACPWNSNDKHIITTYLDSMIQDYTHNITKIYGRPELHMLTLLVAHSCLWYEIDGHRYRGWLDACGFGETRRGKSETIKRIFEWLRLGTSFTCMENFSRAGLTVGGAENGSKMKPGLWPKNNRKMIFLDEFHHMASNTNKNVMVHLQSARDEGRVSALKVYGDLKLPAASRLLTAGNWAGRNRYTFQFFCQHLLEFYGVPESLSRMDFAWCVVGDVSMRQEEVEHFWTSDIARALVLRGWAMEPHQIHRDEGVVEFAKETALKWDKVYAADDLPLHTGIEKYHSILRTATAFANMCYSHPDGRESDCRVRMVHGELAIEWIEKCWRNLQYDKFSSKKISERTLSQPYQVERFLTVELQLSDPDHASIILSRLTESNDPRSLQGLIMGSGNIQAPNEYSHWLATLLRYGAFTESSENKHHIFYGPTEGCIKILSKLVQLARDDPDAYQERYKVMADWTNSPASSMRKGMAVDPEVSPLDEDEGDSFYDEVLF